MPARCSGMMRHPRSRLAAGLCAGYADLMDVLRTSMVVIALFACALLANGAEPIRRSFNIPEGSAPTTLKEFSAQAGGHLLYANAAVQGVRTNAVKGEFTPKEAIDLMLVDTGLLALVDDKNGAVSIRRAEVEDAKNDASRPARSRTAVRNADGRVQLQEYQVVGTKIDGLNNRSLLPAHEEAALPYQVISRGEIEQMGVISTEQLFGNLTQSVNYGTNSQSQVVYSNVVGAQTYSVAAIDLGFGSDQTIVLVNGRRLGNGHERGGPDISRIPLGAIERIEILPAASAAIYGGGAVGGAINIILRKDYETRELTTYVGTSTNGGGTSYRVSYLDGRSFNEGRTKLTTTVDYEHSGGIRQGQRDYLRRALDRYPEGSTDMIFGTYTVFEAYLLPLLAGMPATISMNGAGALGVPGNPSARFAAVPVGLNEAQANALTPASFNATAGAANLGGRHNRAWLIRPKTNYSVQLQLEHEILTGGRLSFYSEANVAYQEASISYPLHFNLNLAANHPFNPFRTGVTPGFVGRAVNVYLDLTDIDEPDTFQERHDARLTFGLKGKVRNNWEWTLDASGQYARVYADSNNPANYVMTLLNTITRAGAAPLAERWAVWNPFVDHTVYPVSREDHDRLFFVNRQSSFYNRNAQLAGRLIGELWELAAGPLRVSTGADLRANQNNGSSETVDSPELSQMVAITLPGKSLTLRSDTTRTAFVETTLPVFSRTWSPVGLQSFEIGASRRWSETNRGRNAVSSTLSGNVWLTKDVMLRASITDGFTALTEFEIQDSLVQENVNNSIRDPQRGNVTRTVTIPVRISGGNPSLRTPTADSLNYGIVLKPRFIPGLTLNVNYTHTKRVDSVVSPSVTNILDFPEDYPGRVERAPLTPDDVALGYTGGSITLLDTSRINMSYRTLESFNYTLNYRLPLPREYGTITWSARATHNNAQRTRVLPNSAEINAAGTQNILKWRGNSSLFWTQDRWTLGVTAYYNNSYYSNTTEPTPAFPTANGLDGRKIKHSLTFDVRGGYRFPAGALGQQGWKSMLNGTTISVGAQNVLDDMGPFVTDGNGFYSRFTNPMQRFVYLELKKSL